MIVYISNMNNFVVKNLQIFLGEFVLGKFIFGHNSWKTDKAHMSPALRQMGKWRQHLDEKVLSFLQLLACFFVPGKNNI